MDGAWLVVGWEGREEWRGDANQNRTGLRQKEVLTPRIDAKKNLEGQDQVLTAESRLGDPLWVLRPAHCTSSKRRDFLPGGRGRIEAIGRAANGRVCL